MSTSRQSTDRPYAARLRIYRPDGTPVETVASDAHGVFSVGLAAGDYIVQPDAGGPPYPRASIFSISVAKGQWRCVTIRYDSGIR